MKYTAIFLAIVLTIAVLPANAEDAADSELTQTTCDNPIYEKMGSMRNPCGNVLFACFDCATLLKPAEVAYHPLDCANMTEREIDAFAKKARKGAERAADDTE